MAFDGSDFGTYLRFAIACMTLALWIWDGNMLPLPF